MPMFTTGFKKMDASKHRISLVSKISQSPQKIFRVSTPNIRHCKCTVSNNNLPVGPIRVSLYIGHSLNINYSIRLCEDTFNKHSKVRKRDVGQKLAQKLSLLFKTEPFADPRVLKYSFFRLNPPQQKKQSNEFS